MYMTSITPSIMHGFCYQTIPYTYIKTLAGVENIGRIWTEYVHGCMDHYPNKEFKQEFSLFQSRETFPCYNTCNCIM